MGSGIRFVLTASAAEMGTYGNSWMRAMMGSFPAALAKPFLWRYLRPQNNPDGSAKFAPYGLRKIECILVQEYGEENVVVTHPSNLEKFVGNDTELIGISTMDPLGFGYVSMTYNPIFGLGGGTVNRIEFLKLMRKPAMLRYRTKKVVGGFGVWQIHQAKLQDRLGIDLLIAGECEEGFLPLLKRLLNGEKLPKYVRTNKLYDYSKVPLIRGASCFGAVEITRGCGRRCQFCSPDYRTKYDFPIEHIMKEVEVNLKGGCNSCFIVTEDIFLYGQDEHFMPNREKLSALLKAIASHPGVKEIAISHASITPVVVDPKLLAEITPIFIEKSHYRRKGRPFVGVDVGIESGSVRIMRRYMGGKSLPYPIEKWPEIVVNGTGIMNDNEWYPMYTFILGLPGEREEDILDTLELFDRLKDHIVMFVPLLFVPFEETVLKNAQRASLSRLKELHWEFLAGCWRHNLRVWAEDIEPLVRMSAFFIYPTYLRWIHGPNSFRPLMRFAGWLGQPSWKSAWWRACDKRYCFGSSPIILSSSKSEKQL